MKKYNAGLDLIRILAMSGVLLVHATIYLPLGRLGNYCTWGAHGVQLFFVLSGYLGVSSYKNRASALKYWQGRAVRILPTYYFAVMCGALMHTFVLRDVSKDLFGLGWLRYLFALNTILPSGNYEICGTKKTLRRRYRSGGGRFLF